MSEESNHENRTGALEKLEGWDRTFAQMWELYFRPEIERRQANGFLPENFSLHGTSPFSARRRKPHRAAPRIQKGEPIRFTDLQYIERFELPDELLDNGYFTVIDVGEGWRMFFNFLSGRAKARDMLELADQFLEAALSSRSSGQSLQRVRVNLQGRTNPVSKPGCELKDAQDGRQRD
jgi:hypothetical protein